jgi:hypothetical protein
MGVNHGEIAKWINEAIVKFPLADLISDGYHTFEELYDNRRIFNSVFYLTNRQSKIKMMSISQYIIQMANYVLAVVGSLLLLNFQRDKLAGILGRNIHTLIGVYDSEDVTQTAAKEASNEHIHQYFEVIPVQLNVYIDKDISSNFY